MHIALLRNSLLTRLNTLKPHEDPLVDWRVPDAPRYSYAFAELAYTRAAMERLCIARGFKRTHETLLEGNPAVGECVEIKSFESDPTLAIKIREKDDHHCARHDDDDDDDDDEDEDDGDDDSDGGDDDD